jgi:hypothetical protein
MHFLAKPFSLKQLAGTVKNAIEGIDPEIDERL